MKFLIDANLPISLCKLLQSLDFDCIHVSTILQGFNSKDKDISDYADNKGLILISKDYDFKTSFLVNGTPKKFIKVNLGNINNSELILYFQSLLKEYSKFKKLDSFMIELFNNNNYTIKY